MESRNQTTQRLNDKEVIGQTRESILPTVVRQDTLSSTTPKVSNLRIIYFKNTAPLTVTNFVGGAEGQSIQLRGDAQTTIANNTNIVTNTGANKLLQLNLVYRFTLFNVSGTLKWLEDA